MQTWESGFCSVYLRWVIVILMMNYLVFAIDGSEGLGTLLTQSVLVTVRIEESVLLVSVIVVGLFLKIERCITIEQEKY